MLKLGRKPKQKIMLITDGTYKNTKLFINDLEIKFDSLSITGDKNIDLDIYIGLSQSKVTTNTVKNEAKLSDAIGFSIGNEEYEGDEEFEVT